MGIRDFGKFLVQKEREVMAPNLLTNIHSGRIVWGIRWVDSLSPTYSSTNFAGTRIF
jgi:hypothetical protein